MHGFDEVAYEDIMDMIDFQGANVSVDTVSRRLTHIDTQIFLNRCICPLKTTAQAEPDCFDLLLFIV